MTPEDLGIKPQPLKVGTYEGRVIVQFSEGNPMGFLPDDALVLASLLLSNSVKARAGGNKVQEAVNDVYANGDNDSSSATADEKGGK